MTFMLTCLLSVCLHKRFDLTTNHHLAMPPPRNSALDSDSDADFSPSLPPTAKLPRKKTTENKAPAIQATQSSTTTRRPSAKQAENGMLPSTLNIHELHHLLDKQRADKLAANLAKANATIAKMKRAAAVKGTTGKDHCLS
jgi:hypothetical protein